MGGRGMRREQQIPGRRMSMAENDATPAPDFPDGMDWLNTDHPLTMAELRGKLVVLDFWTYC